MPEFFDPRDRGDLRETDDRGLITESKAKVVGLSQVIELGRKNSGGNRWTPYEVERRNFLCLGKKGTGKTKTLERWFLDDVYAGKGAVLIGNIGWSLARIPRSRIGDVIVIDPGNTPFGLNVLYGIRPDLYSRAADNYYEALRSHWFTSDISTANIEQYVKAGIQTLLSVPDATFLHLQLLLTNPGYRREALRHVTDPALRLFWKEYDEKPKKELGPQIESTLNKLRTLSFEPVVRNCIGQKKNFLSFTNKIVLVELSETLLGTGNAHLLGNLLLAYLDVKQSEGEKTNLYLPQVHRFGLPMLEMLLRSPQVTVQMSLDHLRHMEEYERLLGAVDTVICFRTTVRDAKEIEGEFFLDTGDHLYNLPDNEAYYPEGTRSTLLRMGKALYRKTAWAAKIRRTCAANFTAPKEEIAERIEGIYAPAPEPKKGRKK